MRQIRHSLWLGHAGDVRAVLDAGVEAVVELADNEPLATLPRELIRLRFPLSDDEANPAWLLRLAVDSVAALIRAGAPTLLCCSAGMSRSLCVAAAGIASVEGRSFSEVLAALAGAGPADVSPGLFVQIQRALSESATDGEADR